MTLIKKTQTIVTMATMFKISPIYGTRLTEREKEICNLVAAGLTSKSIAAALSISEYTVANHRKSILQKKGVRSVREVVRIK